MVRKIGALVSNSDFSIIVSKEMDCSFGSNSWTAIKYPKTAINKVAWSWDYSEYSDILANFRAKS